MRKLMLPMIQIVSILISMKIGSSRSSRAHIDPFEDDIRSEPTNLIDTIMRRYDKRVRPFAETQRPVTIHMTIVLGILTEVRENQQVASFVISHVQKWRDPKLAWDPRNHSGITQVVMPRNLVWVPKLFIYNSMDTKDMLTEDRFDVRVQHTGHVKVNIPQFVSTICRINIDLFPFDTQFCAIALASPLLNVEEMDVNATQPPIDSYFSGNAEWQVMNVSVNQITFMEEGESRAEVHYILHLNRRPTYYITVIVVPTFLISALSILGIFSPGSNDGPRNEKVSLGLGSLLAMTVLLDIVAGAMPKSDSIPLLGYYIMLVILLCAIGVAVSMAMLSMSRNCIQTAKMPPPHYYKLLFLGVCRVIKQNGVLSQPINEKPTTITPRFPDLISIYNQLVEVARAQKTYRERIEKQKWLQRVGRNRVEQNLCAHRFFLPLPLRNVQRVGVGAIHALRFSTRPAAQREFHDLRGQQQRQKGLTMRRNSPLWRALPMLILWCTVATVLSQQYPQQQQEDRCQDRSCYPITGNLLIGRKSQLSTTSTCGSQGRQRFCIVSHLEEQTKCFYCDSRTEWKPQREPYRLSHRIENVVSEVFEDKNRNWWQSENGQQNVTIQLDLEAEFHFTHLIMTFKSFRPAAMLIERSADFGKTWQIYRYFAYDCDQSFPGIAERTPVNHTDVICTSQYSDVAPSTGGEIVYKVISPHIETTNPYATEIANLLKITNLRFNFTKLHTLGDDLLDYRPEIDEKYYYAIYELVVRGSCSCYGHASRCIPIDPHSSPNTVMERPDIVHGRCECMHNTEGLNCEKCKAFFNDAPWRPAIGDEKNECRQCNCNRHAARCHFDTAVYMASGNVSGGVCDDCMHNTQGKHCEQCKPFFYRDPRRQIDDEAVCLPCQCHKAGSQNRGICEGEEDAERGLVAGKCYCKTNVDGQRCDRCKNGYWNLTEENVDGCVACTCNLLGTYNNEGCDKYTGMCTCKRLVTGENCDQCLPEHYGLSEHVDGCKACECDIGGSYDNTCDLQTGQCKCREGFTGRRCDTADSSFYCADITHYVYEAEYANVTRGDVKTREWPANAYEQTWTGEGFVEIGEGSIITVYPQVETTSKYNVILRHDAARDPIGWENVQLTVVRPDNEDGLCDVDPARDFVATRLFPGSRYHEIQPAICLEAGKQYELRIQFNEKRTNSHPQERAAARLLIDSVLLAPPTEELHIFQGDGRAQQYLQEYQRYQCRHLALSLANNQAEQRNEVCQRYVCPVAAALLNKTVECNCDATGSVSGICDIHGGQCECKPNVVGRRCDQCAIGTYGFGPSGCSKCDCDAVGSLGNDCDKQSGQCECREKGIYGRQCNQCQPGFWGFPECRTCQCNDHANICDQTSGACIECRDLTTGHYCDRCQDGYYGDPRLGVGIACKPCPCPGGPTSGYQHADTCYLRNNAGNNTQDIVCNCKSGYEGERCGECSSNYWGSPKEVGGSCERCDCNGNIDMGVDGSCDATTGECLKCLHNTIGAQCETCADGFFGDAKQRTCQRCVCNQLGTNSTSPDFAICDKTTGQCPCHANVVGARCDACDKNHYNLASGDGCESCDCDPLGVVEVAGTASPGDSQIIAVPHLQCNEFDGQCACKAGRGGRRCNECEDFYWGDPQQSNGCQKCQCNPTGAKTLQCHRSNGTCECHPGSGGALCDQCARGFTGTWPQCRPCGECFHQWDAIMQKLKAQVDTLITTANNIEDTGVSSAYDADFEKMEATLRNTKQALADANISKEDIVEMSEKIRLLKGQVGAAREKLGRVETRISNLTQSVDFAQKDLERLQKESDKVTALTIELEEKAQQIKEADVLGAFNITRESGATSLDAQRRTDAAISRLARAENDATQAAQLLDNNKDDFEKQFSENEAALTDAERVLGELEATLPSLNEQVCGASTAPCDALCGGPGHCGFCGGQSCMEGAVSKASQARTFANEADTKLDEKQKEAEEVLSIVQNVLLSTSAAKSRAEKALAAAKSAAERANATRHSLDRIADDITTFLSAKRATPEQIRQLAEDALTKKISLTPSQITDLTGKIKEALAKINNIGDILDETRDNKTLASALESQASRVSQRAEDIKTTMDAVREALRVAEEAQEAASLAIAEAEEITNTARNDLEEAKNETLTTEEKAREANASLAELESIMGTVKVDYLQISEQAKNALKTVDDALQAASNAEQKNEQISGDIARANELLEKRSEGHEAPQKRAEKLRERAAKLLYQSQRHSSDIENLSRDATETRLDDYEQILADLNARLERVTADIHEKTDFHSTCG